MSDWGGNLFKINAQTGAQIWSNTIANYIGDPSIPTAVSRTSAAVEGNKLIIGSQEGYGSNDSSEWSGLWWIDGIRAGPE